MARLWVLAAGVRLGTVPPQSSSSLRVSGHPAQTLLATEYVDSVAVGTYGGVYLTGYTQGDLTGTGNAGGYDIFLLKSDFDGNLW